MAIQLTDDGTMDTVLKCSKCGEEMRYNFDGAEDTDAGERLMPMNATKSWRTFLS